MRESSDGKEKARLAATLTAEADREQRPAPAVTSNEVLAALEQAGFEIEQLLDDCGDLGSWLGVPQRCNRFWMTVASVPHEVSVLSYSDAQDATRVARRVREIYQSTQGNFSAYALSHGAVVVMVSPVDEGLLDRVRAILESMPRE